MSGTAKSCRVRKIVGPVVCMASESVSVVEGGSIFREAEGGEETVAVFFLLSSHHRGRILIMAIVHEFQTAWSRIVESMIIFSHFKGVPS